jgi:hypothetical protein
VQAVPSADNEILRALKKHCAEGRIGIQEKLHGHGASGEEGVATLPFFSLHKLAAELSGTIRNNTLRQRNDNVGVAISVAARTTNAAVARGSVVRGWSRNEVTSRATGAENTTPERLRAPDVGASGVDTGVPFDYICP